MWVLRQRAARRRPRCRRPARGAAARCAAGEAQPGLLPGHSRAERGAGARAPLPRARRRRAARSRTSAHDERAPRAPPAPRARAASARRSACSPLPSRVLARRPARPGCAAAATRRPRPRPPRWRGAAGGSWTSRRGQALAPALERHRPRRPARGCSPRSIRRQLVDVGEDRLGERVERVRLEAGLLARRPPAAARPPARRAGRPRAAHRGCGRRASRRGRGSGTPRGPSSRSAPGFARPCS